MRTLQTGLWVWLVVMLFGFAYLNGDKVTIHLWPDVSADTKIWFLVIGSMLLGFVPTWLMLRTTQWRMARRISTLEATLAAQSHALTQAAESRANEIS